MTPTIIPVGRQMLCRIHTLKGDSLILKPERSQPDWMYLEIITCGDDVTPYGETITGSFFTCHPENLITFPGWPNDLCLVACDSILAFYIFPTTARAAVVNEISASFGDL